MRLLRRRRVPAAVRESLRRERGERVITYAVTRDGRYVVATGRALYLPGDVRLPWEQVHQATWHGGWLYVQETSTLDARGGEHHLRLDDPGRLPEAVRERVSATILVNQYARLTGDHGVRVVARRSPTGTETTWTLVFDAELDPHDPALRTAAGQVLEEIRRQTGV